jgi:hypothetical protein
VTPVALRLLERVHGHLGWLAAVALVHPAIALRNPRRRARLSAVLSATIVLLSGVFGAIIYSPYNQSVKRSMYVASRTYGLLFERKEHLAFAAIAFACAGCIAHLAAGRDDRALARFAHLAFVASALLAIVVATLGTLVAAFKSFA